MAVGGFQRVSAAEAKQQSGFNVSPAQLSFVVGPGEPIGTRTVTITNAYATTLNLTAELQAIDELGARLIPSGPIDDQLQKAIKISATDIVVPANGNYKLEVTVDGMWLGDGGHYVSLLLAQRATATASSGFRSAVAVNLFIVKNERIRTDLRLQNVSFDRPFLSLPKAVSVTLRNEGNTHVVPRASVIVYDGQDVVSKAVVNTSSAPLLPGHEETFIVKLDTYKRFWLPRRLIAQTMYRIDGSDIQLMKEQTVWHIPFVDLIGLVALGFAGWRWRKKIVATCVKIKNTLKAHIFMKRQKHLTKNTTGAGASHTGAVITRMPPMEQTQKILVLPPRQTSQAPKGSSETTPRRIEVKAPETTGVKHLSTPTKHIAVMTDEVDIKDPPLRSVPTKTAARKKTAGTKKTKTSAASRAKKASSVKKSAPQPTKKKSS